MGLSCSDVSSQAVFAGSFSCQTPRGSGKRHLTPDHELANPLPHPPAPSTPFAPRTSDYLHPNVRGDGGKWGGGVGTQPDSSMEALFGAAGGDEDEVGYPGSTAVDRRCQHSECDWSAAALGGTRRRRRSGLSADSEPGGSRAL
ncbi:unnamed protein product [Gadus morhua 'NCC']